MKTISYKVAKSLKEAGYNEPCDMYYHIYDDEDESQASLECTGGKADFLNSINHYRCAEPTYLEVWLWLWRKKKVELSFNYGFCVNDVEENLYCLSLKEHGKSYPHMKYIIQDMNYDAHKCCSHGFNHEHADPEQAIINAIEYLAVNILIR